MEGFSGPEALTTNQLDGIEMPTIQLYTTSRHSNKNEDSKWYGDWARFTGLVESYASRQITFESDVLDALNGAMHNIRRSRPSAYNICGLPLFKQDAPKHENMPDPYVNSNPQSLDQMVFTVLSWYNKDNTLAEQRRYRFPSWTWADWRCVPEFQPHNMGNRNCTPVLRGVQLMVSRSNILKLPELWPNDERDWQADLDTVKMIEAEAPLMPIDCISEPSVEISENFDGETSKTVFGIDGGVFMFSAEPSITFYNEMINKIKSHKWLLLLLGESSDWGCRSRHLLLVEWAEDGLMATRVGGFLVEWKLPSLGYGYGMDYGEIELRSPESMEWRRVRLA